MKEKRYDLFENTSESRDKISYIFDRPRLYGLDKIILCWTFGHLIPGKQAIEPKTTIQLRSNPIYENIKSFSDEFNISAKDMRFQ